MQSQIVVVAWCFALLSTTLPAQQDSLSPPADKNLPAAVWIIPIGIGTAVAFDEEAREAALSNRTHSLDRLARLVNPLGTARRLVPALAIVYAGAKLTSHDSLARGTLNSAAGYVASDVVESLLKPIVGRERPSVAGNSRRFHPFASSGDWHSFPSAHVAHITSIVEAASMQTHSDVISAAGDVLISLMAWDRIYEDQHWASDVVATVALSSIVSGTTVRWVESHWPR
jgi:membrane-associated phospholipid phosphatase